MNQTGPLQGSNRYLTRKLDLEDGTTVAQTPGLTMTEEEHQIVNEGILVYTFQVELKLKSNSTEMRMFHDFVNIVKMTEPITKFLP